MTLKRKQRTYETHMKLHNSNGMINGKADIELKVWMGKEFGGVTKGMHTFACNIYIGYDIVYKYDSIWHLAHSHAGMYRHDEVFVIVASRTFFA